MTRHDRKYLVKQIDEQEAMILELEDRLDKILDIIAPPEYEQGIPLPKQTRQELIEENRALRDCAVAVRDELDDVLSHYREAAVPEEGGEGKETPPSLAASSPEDKPN